MGREGRDVVLVSHLYIPRCVPFCSSKFRLTSFTVQTSTDPFLANAGNGLLPNGSFVTPVPNPTNVYTPWNTTLAKAWLKGLKNKPTLVAIDNEIEIASNTHQDMHPV